MENLAGKQFGLWTVLEDFEQDENGSFRWKCRCKCGTERMVLARSLRGGVSQSCGCLRKQRRKAQKDLTGRTFGRLTVLRPADNSPGCWVCRCAACGQECECTRKRVMSGKTPHCGCKAGKSRIKKDITGQTFRMLTALYPTAQRDYKGSVIWHCRCECGNEIDVSYNVLNYSSVVSCGCHKDAVSKNLKNYLTHVAGTSVDMLKSRKSRTDNSSGVTGVYLVRGKYRAEICFQQKKYYLGTYATLETAAFIRGEAEQLLHKDFVSFYERWKQKAESDPAWADAHPVSVQVKQLEYGDFQVRMLPKLD